MAANFYGAMCAWSVCFLVTAGVSLVTKRKPTDELVGLVYQRPQIDSSSAAPNLKGAWIFAACIVAALVIVNWIFY
jgi:SSS family solute:Na+ symporter